MTEFRGQHEEFGSAITPLNRPTSDGDFHPKPRSAGCWNRAFCCLISVDKFRVFESSLWFQRSPTLLTLPVLKNHLTVCRDRIRPDSSQKIPRHAGRTFAVFLFNAGQFLR